MITENLSTLKINKLTQEQYNRELEAGRIDEHAIYLTPGEEIDLSVYLPIDGSVSMTGGLKNETSSYQFATKDRLIGDTNYRTIWGLGKKTKSTQTIGTASVELRSSVDNYGSLLNRLDLASDGEIYVNTSNRLFGEHNKPSGSYTGNGQSSRNISIGGASGGVLFLYNSSAAFCCFVTKYGMYGIQDNEVGYVKTTKYIDGVLTINGTGDVNEEGRTIMYQVL